MKTIMVTTLLEDRKRKKLPVLTKLGFGMGEGGWNILITPVSLFGLFFLTDVVGLNPGIAGFIAGFAFITDAVTDTIIGAWSDSCSSRFGRRRPFILLGILPLAFIFVLTFTHWEFNRFLTVLYYLLVNFCFYTALTVVHIPYSSMVPEMTFDYDERTSIDAYRAGWTQIGLILGAVLPLALVDQLGGTKQAWALMSIILGILATVFYLVAWNASRGLELKPRQMIR